MLSSKDIELYIRWSTIFWLEKRPLHKSVRIRSYSGPCFPVFGLNKEIYSLPVRIQSECEKIQTRTTPNTDTFYAMSFKSHKVGKQSFIHFSSIFSFFDEQKLLQSFSKNLIETKKDRAKQKSFGIDFSK